METKNPRHLSGSSSKRGKNAGESVLPVVNCLPMKLFVEQKNQQESDGNQRSWSGGAGTPKQYFQKYPEQKLEMTGDSSGSSFLVIPCLEALWEDMTETEKKNLDMS